MVGTGLSLAAAVTLGVTGAPVLVVGPGRTGGAGVGVTAGAYGDGGGRRRGGGRAQADGGQGGDQDQRGSWSGAGGWHGRHLEVITGWGYPRALSDDKERKTPET